MTWLYYVAGGAVFLITATAVAALLVVAHAAQGCERLMESEGQG
jgi:hypothetical protein